jgi:prepilin-type N-terminal cleavage/methylation domain-containing protein/prepilin-type processing-associated H-X9-DG protein
MNTPCLPIPNFKLSEIKNRRSTSGFTLIELLTVIAIIGILAAIIIPTVGKVRESARSVKCLSNLRQLAMANRIHAGDNKDRMVNPYGVDGLSWNKQLAPYIGKAAALNGDGSTTEGSGWTDNTKSITNCPSRVSGSEVNVASYGWNAAMYYDSSWTAGINSNWPNYLFSRPPTPSRIIMVGDMVELNDAFIKPPGGDSDLSTAAGWCPEVELTRHGGKGNFAFMDCSVRALKAEDLVSNDTSSLFRWW